MIIKSHIRGGYRAAANYLKDPGENENVRLVQIGDHDARNLDQAFHNMWVVGRTTRATKALHHVSINPARGERLIDDQVLKICQRLEEKYGYRPGNHQRVIVEHIKDGRQHFHVMWHRVSLGTGRVVWPGHHWKKSKQTAREMEAELGLKRPQPRGTRFRSGALRLKLPLLLAAATSRAAASISKPLHPTMPQLPHLIARHYRRPYRADARHPAARRPVAPRGMSVEELIAWAWENRRADILAQFGIYVSFGI
jgi:hypothetical protein